MNIFDVISWVTTNNTPHHYFADKDNNVFDIRMSGCVPTKIFVYDDEKYGFVEITDFSIFEDNQFRMLLEAEAKKIMAPPEKCEPLLTIGEDKSKSYLKLLSWFGEDPIFNFKENGTGEKWKKAIATFLRLKQHPLARKCKHEDGLQWVIILRATMFKAYTAEYELTTDCWRSTYTKIAYLSPCFNLAEDANKAIKELGKDNLLEMFRTFQGVE